VVSALQTPDGKGEGQDSEGLRVLGHWGEDVGVKGETARTALEIWQLQGLT